MRRIEANPRLAFLAGLLLPAMVVIVFEVVDFRPMSGSGSSEPAYIPGRFGIDFDIQKHGPLGYGSKMTLAEAAARVPYRLPLPPTNTTTANQTGIWVGGGGNEGTEFVSPSVGFVWETNLSFVIHPVDSGDLSEQQAVDGWAEKVQTQGEEGWMLVSVRGHTALAAEAEGIDEASLTWMEDGFLLAFYAPDLPVAQLQALAEQVTYSS